MQLSAGVQSWRHDVEIQRGDKELLHDSLEDSAFRHFGTPRMQRSLVINPRDFSSSDDDALPMTLMITPCQAQPHAPLIAHHRPDRDPEQARPVSA